MSVVIGGKEVGGARKRYYDACIWCGRELNPGCEYKSKFPFCGEKCQREYEAAHEIGDRKHRAEFENERILEGVKREPQDGGQSCEVDIRLWDRVTWIEHLLDCTADEITCDWSQFLGEDWVVLLSKRPELAAKCDWKVLTLEQWRDLLVEQPQFSNVCDCWPQFDDETVAMLLDGSDLISKYGGMLNANQWAYVLVSYPECANQFNKWGDIDVEHWLYLLEFRPQFAAYCDKWHLFPSGQLLNLCQQSPDISKFFPKELKGVD